MLTVEYVDISTIKPYKHNAKKHPKDQIAQIAKSITDFGMNDPIAVAGPDSEIIEGHGRYLACKDIGMASVPIIRLDHLDDEQRRAYNLIHNKLCLNSDFDLKLLSQELDNIVNVDMSDFDFDVDNIKTQWDEIHEQNKDDEKTADANILNLAKVQYPGVGPYEMPQLSPEIGLPEVTEWIGFNYVLTEKNPENKGVHFFLNDYQFERIWNNTDKYIDKLSKFAVVAAPDFSPYADMPFCLQLYNHYRKQWVGHYMQDVGIKVIPTITPNTGPHSDKFYLEGMPIGGSVIISSMWTKTADEKKLFLSQYAKMFDTLNPDHVYVYGKKLDGMRGNITTIKTFAQKKFVKD